jgi:phage terminase large subunit-like protein
VQAVDRILERIATKSRALGVAMPDPAALIGTLSNDDVEALLAEILVDEERAMFNKFADLFPDDGPYRRELYKKHLRFFSEGKRRRERLFLAGNRTGKTVAGGYEATSHLTGDYAHWWEGREFRKPIRAWVAGDTNETTRDILQQLLLGNICYDGPLKGVDGSGLIPRANIGRPIWKTGVQNMVDTVPIKHKSGGWSTLGFKSYDQGRRVFQGTAKELIWLDEEVPEDVYNECLVRTATTRGILILTFTPLMGITKLVDDFLSDAGGSAIF